MNQDIIIDGRLIGAQSPPYIVAELSANHGGSLERALTMIAVAKEMGADAVKIQTYEADTITLDCQSEDFQIHGGLWGGSSLYQLYQRAQTPFAWHQALFAKAKEVGITLFSAPFDFGAVSLLQSLSSPAYKIASFEAIDLPLIEKVVEAGKPLIISTGMADLSEITAVVSTARLKGCQQLALLHCVSGYPTPVEQSYLRTLVDLQERFNVTVGLSDHTLGLTTSIAAVALGASIIEKHFTLSRAEESPDSTFSIEPDELRVLCTAAKEAWQALGEVSYKRKPVEQANIKFRRSLYTVKDIAANECLSADNVRSIRPGFGLAPKNLSKVLGRKALTNIPRGTALSWELISSE